jgi:antitoxin CptB
MAWAIGTQPVPDTYEGPMMEAMRKLDYIPNPGTANFRSH